MWNCDDRVKSGPAINGTDPSCHASHRCSWPGTSVWPPLVRPWQRDDGLGRKRSWSVLHLWCWGRWQVPAQTRPWPHLQGSPGAKDCLSTITVEIGCMWCYFANRFSMKLLIWAYYTLHAGCGGWLWVFCQASAGNALLRAQLLRRVWQRWRNDERGRDADVLLPGTVWHVTR